MELLRSNRDSNVAPRSTRVCPITLKYTVMAERAKRRAEDVGSLVDGKCVLLNCQMCRRPPITSASPQTPTTCHEATKRQNAAGRGRSWELGEST